MICCSCQIINNDALEKKIEDVQLEHNTETMPLENEMDSKKCPEKKSFECEIANYQQKQGLKMHKLSVHDGKKPFKCEVCDYSCSQKGHLNRHIASVHEGMKPFKCEKCLFYTKK